MRWFYEQLRTAPPFRIAWFGQEAYDWWSDQPDPTPNIHLRQAEGSGLVVANAEWEAKGSPEGGLPFSATHRWWPPSELTLGG